MSFYPIAVAVVAPVSGWLSDKISYKPLTVAGLSVNTIGLLLVANLNAASSIFIIGLLITLLGIGGALFQSPNNSSIMGAVPRDKLGIAGSINSFFRNFGMVSGTALAVIMFTLVTKTDINRLSGGSFDTNIFMNGFHIVLTNSAVLLVVAVLASLLRVREKKVKAKIETNVEGLE
jgi:MFS family permease